jgi:bacterioferritin
MKGDPQIIESLNRGLTVELTAINQYFIQAKMNKNWGFSKLAKKHYSESIGEMKHADKLMERIFMLDGLPNLQDLGKLMIGEDAPEALKCDLKMELTAHPALKEGIAHCEAVGDYISRELLEDILDPSRNVDQAMRSTTLYMKDGKTVSGLVLREEGGIHGKVCGIFCCLWLAQATWLFGWPMHWELPAWQKLNYFVPTMIMAWAFLSVGWLLRKTYTAY